MLPLDVVIRRPLGVGIGGLALLGAMDPAESEAIVRLNGPRYGGFGGLTTDLVLQAVCETRKRGYSFMDGVVTPGVADLSVGFPLQQPVAAICVAAISGRMNESRHAELVKRIRVQIASITSVLATLGDIAPT